MAGCTGCAAGAGATTGAAAVVDAVWVEGAGAGAVTPAVMLVVLADDPLACTLVTCPIVTSRFSGTFEADEVLLVALAETAGTADGLAV
jgi:hypothetical protein